MGDGSLVAPVEGGVGIRVAVAVTVGEAGRSAGVVAVTTSVGPAVLVGADAVGAAAEVVVVVGVGLGAVSSMPDESSVQAASKSSPAASDSSPTTRDGGTINGLLVMTGLPVYRHRLYVNVLPNRCVSQPHSVELYVS